MLRLTFEKFFQLIKFRFYIFGGSERSFVKMGEVLKNNTKCIMGWFNFFDNCFHYHLDLKKNLDVTVCVDVAENSF